VRKSNGMSRVAMEARGAVKVAVHRNTSRRTPEAPPSSRLGSSEQRLPREQQQRLAVVVELMQGLAENALSARARSDLQKRRTHQSMPQGTCFVPNRGWTRPVSIIFGTRRPLRLPPLHLFQLRCSVFYPCSRCVELFRPSIFGKGEPSTGPCAQRKASAASRGQSPGRSGPPGRRSGASACLGPRGRELGCRRYVP